MRRLKASLESLLEHSQPLPCWGARQVGKTTLVQLLAAERKAVYLDLESVSDMDKLSDPEAYLVAHEQRLVIIDEVQGV